jgi:hypothetical protein
MHDRAGECFPVRPVGNFLQVEHARRDDEVIVFGTVASAVDFSNDMPAMVVGGSGFDDARPPADTFANTEMLGVAAQVAAHVIGLAGIAASLEATASPGTRRPIWARARVASDNYWPRLRRVRSAPRRR